MSHWIAIFSDLRLSLKREVNKCIIEDILQLLFNAFIGTLMNGGLACKLVDLFSHPRISLNTDNRYGTHEGLFFLQYWQQFVIHAICRVEAAWCHVFQYSFIVWMWPATLPPPPPKRGWVTISQHGHYAFSQVHVILGELKLSVISQWWWWNQARNNHQASGEFLEAVLDDQLACMETAVSKGRKAWIVSGHTSLLAGLALFPMQQS